MVDMLILIFWTGTLFFLFLAVREFFKQKPKRFFIFTFLLGSCGSMVWAFILTTITRLGLGGEGLLMVIHLTLLSILAHLIIFFFPLNPKRIKTDEYSIFD